MIFGTPYVGCPFCNGTGLDEADWSGRCFNCDGHGAIPDDDEVCRDDNDEEICDCCK